MLNDKEFEDLFRKRFDDFGDEPPEKGWEKIQAELRGKRPRPGFSWLWAALVGLVLLSIPVGIYFTSDDQAQPTKSPEFVEESASASHPQASNTPTEPQAVRKTHGVNRKAIDGQPERPQDGISTDTFSVPGIPGEISPVVVQNGTTPYPSAVKSGVEPAPLSEKEAKVPSSGIKKSEEGVGKRHAGTPQFSDKKRKADDVEDSNHSINSPVYAKKKSRRQWEKNEYKIHENLPEVDSASIKKNRVVTRNTNRKGRIVTDALPSTNPASELITNPAAEVILRNDSDSTEPSVTQAPDSERGQNVSDDKDAPKWAINYPKASMGRYRKPVDSLPILPTRTWHTQLPPDSLSAIRMQPIALNNRKVEAGMQDTMEVLPKPSKYAVGVYYSPRYSFSRFVVNREDPIFVDQIQTKGRPLSDRLGYEVGLTLSRKLSEKWRLNASLVYVHISEVVRFRSRSIYPDSIRVSHSPSDTINVSPVFNTQAQRYESTYDYAGLNLGVSYAWLKGSKGELYVSAGMGMRLLVRGTTHRYQNERWMETVYFPAPDNPLEQLNTQLSLGIGYARRLNKTMKITIEPTINYFLGSTFKEREPVGIKPYTLGVNIGLLLGR